MPNEDWIVSDSHSDTSSSSCSGSSSSVDSNIRYDTTGLNFIPTAPKPRKRIKTALDTSSSEDDGNNDGSSESSTSASNRQPRFLLRRPPRKRRSREPLPVSSSSSASESESQDSEYEIEAVHARSDAEHFSVFVQYVIMCLLNPAFGVTVRRDNDVHFLAAEEWYFARLGVVKSSLLGSGAWNLEFMKDLEGLPGFQRTSMSCASQADPYTGKVRCSACHRPIKAEAIVVCRLFGVRYDSEDHRVRRPQRVLGPMEAKAKPGTLRAWVQGAAARRASGSSASSGSPSSASSSGKGTSDGGDEDRHEEVLVYLGGTCLNNAQQYHLLHHHFHHFVAFLWRRIEALRNPENDSGSDSVSPSSTSEDNTSQEKSDSSPSVIRFRGRRGRGASSVASKTNERSQVAHNQDEEQDEEAKAEENLRIMAGICDDQALMTVMFDDLNRVLDSTQAARTRVDVDTKDSLGEKVSGKRLAVLLPGLSPAHKRAKKAPSISTEPSDSASQSSDSEMSRDSRDSANFQAAAEDDKSEVNEEDEEKDENDYSSSVSSDRLRRRYVARSAKPIDLVSVASDENKSPDASSALLQKDLDSPILSPKRSASRHTVDGSVEEKSDSSASVVRFRSARRERGGSSTASKGRVHSLQRLCSPPKATTKMRSSSSQTQDSSDSDCTVTLDNCLDELPNLPAEVPAKPFFKPAKRR